MLRRLLTLLRGVRDGIGFQPEGAVPAIVRHPLPRVLAVIRATDFQAPMRTIKPKPRHLMRRRIVLGLEEMRGVNVSNKIERRLVLVKLPKRYSTGRRPRSIDSLRQSTG